MKTSLASLRPLARRGRVRGPAGFTLVEALVALLVFSLGILALGLVIPMATGRINRAGSQTRASALAAERAETLLITPYGHGDLAQGTHADPANPVDGLYYVKWTVTDDQPITACKRVVVSVARWGLNRTPEAAVTIVTPQSGG
jgi:prepilin-type N-terminal cleavage/methylation domain-containing protein